MRELTGSRSVIAILIGLYVCASLAAVPVPRFLASAFDLSTAGATESVCTCGAASACSTSGSCCCAAKALANPAAPIASDTESRTGPEVMTFGCTPPLKWFLAAVPVTSNHSAVSRVLADHDGERLIAYEEPTLGSRSLDVTSPPPKRSV
ncbi:MAG: hypothetical protein KDA31_08280 [Phycisphaerales bacterium]|nr:hypothetical protein [Phycisphaerales bacterium]MCB9835907.1 hypothetical protein [Phycisphaera sp.]